jgi:hypothetical protein
MATQKEANLARDQHADRLAQMGAHSIGVDKFVHGGKKTYGVVAYIQDHKIAGGFPSQIAVKTGGKQLMVPLQTKVAGTFKPE